MRHPILLEKEGEKIRSDCELKKVSLIGGDSDRGIILEKAIGSKYWSRPLRNRSNENTENLITTWKTSLRDMMNIRSICMGSAFPNAALHLRTRSTVWSIVPEFMEEKRTQPHGIDGDAEVSWIVVIATIAAIQKKLQELESALKTCQMHGRNIVVYIKAFSTK